MKWQSEKTPVTLDASVVTRLRSVAARIRAYLLVEGVAWVTGFLVLAGMVQFLLDYGTRGLRWSMRAALLGLIVAGAFWLVWSRIVVPLRRRFGIAEVANLVERRHPELSSLLITAVRFSLGETGPAESNAPALVASVIARAGPEVQRLDFGAVLDPQRACRSGVALTGAILICAVTATVTPDKVGLWFARNVLLQEVEWPKRTHLIVDLEGDELIGARGDDLVVQAHADGVQPRVVEIIYTTQSGQRGRESMVTVGSRGSYRYRYTFKNAREDFVFRLEGGDDRTGDFKARLLERPRVTRTEMRIVPPAYASQEATNLGDGQRAAQILPGGKVTIWVETNKPVINATLMAGNETVAEATRQGERFAVTLSPLETHTYHFALLDQVGLENRRPVRFSVRVIRDEPPRARVNIPGAGDMITPEALLPIEVEYADTYGLATAELVYRISRDAAEDGSIELPTFTPHVKNFSTSLAWPVSTKALGPGDVLTLLARATDFDDVRGPNSSQSPEVTFRVVTRDELLAELARREQEYRADFERLIDSQEQLRRGLLTVLGDFQESQDSATLPVDLAPLERRQRNITGSVNVIRQQFERIMAELHVNRLDNLDERERLQTRIVEPLEQLAKRDLVLSADSVRQWSREGTAEKAAQIDPQQVAILSQMQTVLSNMIQWEGYQEVVGMLRDIIRLQKELNAEAKDALQDQAGDVFDD